MSDLPNFTGIMTGDPEVGLANIWADLERRLLQQGVKQHSLAGIKIAFQIAYRLGERAGLQAVVSDGQAMLKGDDDAS
jgi:hypothetical protein